ncbi:MAG: prepilin-type N-terminal cleavage/methylation domain-containing protein [Planctomycetota bacterium]
MMRRGFTLIELATSLGVLGILVGAMASSITLASRAMPSSTDEATVLATTSRAWDVIADDLRIASDILITDGTRLEMLIKADSNDGTSETQTVVVEWSGAVGDPLLRTMGEGPTALLVSSVDDLAFTGLSKTPPRVQGKIAIGGISIIAEQRCLNAETIR